MDLSICLVFCRTDVKQYEYNYVVCTLTRHLNAKPPFIKEAKCDQSNYLADGTNANNGPKSKPSNKLVFRRQNTCADPTAAAYGNAHVEDYFLPDSKIDTGKVLRDNIRQSRRLDAISKQLDSIKHSLATLDREQMCLKSEMIQLNHRLKHTTMQNTLHSGHQIVNTEQNSTMYITKARIKHLYLRIPSEIRLVLVVLLSHLIINYLSAFLFPVDVISPDSSKTAKLPTTKAIKDKLDL